MVFCDIYKRSDIESCDFKQNIKNNHGPGVYKELFIDPKPINEIIINNLLSGL